MKVLVVGGKRGTDVGDSFVHAGTAAGLEMSLLDAAAAHVGPRWLGLLYWHLLDHRPQRLAEVSARVVEECDRLRPDVLLTTGLAPVLARDLAAIGRKGIRRLNYSTDDPWSRYSGSRWFFDAAKRYDVIFTPRRANFAQLQGLGGPEVRYLPFAYDPRHFHGNDVIAPAEEERVGSDVLFVGGGDRDRLPFLSALTSRGFRVALYGGHWERFAATRAITRGSADPATLRIATRTTKVAICLVRRLNRDGHVMRTFEIPAVGACMLAEDTDEHRALFGAEDECVRYFKSIDEMVRKVGDLLEQPAERARLARAAHARVIEGKHTYGDRLHAMLFES